MDSGTAIFAGLALLALVLWGLNLHLSNRRNGHRSDEIGGYRIKPELGMEATDTAAFNAAMSRNAPLGEVPQELQGLGRKVSTYVAPVKQDKTYASRFHAAFGKSEKRE